MSWPTVALGDICAARSSLVDPTLPQHQTLPHIAPDNIERDSGRLLGYRSVAEDGVKSGKYLFEAGDLLYSKIRPNLNKVTIAGFRGLCSADVYALKVDRRVAELTYVAHVLRSRQFLDYAGSLANRANIPKLNRSQLMAFPLDLPPLDEQRRIAAILDQARQLVALREKQLQTLLTLREATFLELFGRPATWPSRWVMTTIGELAESVDYGTSERSTIAGELPVLRMGNISYRGDLDLGDLKYTTLSGDAVARYTVRPGDLLFNRTNSPALVGKTAVVDVDRPMAFAGYLIRVRMKEDVRPEFVSGYLNSEHGKALLRGMAKSAISQANINAKEMRGIRIARPPLDLQQRYVEQLAVLGRHRAKCAADLMVQQTLVAALQPRPTVDLGWVGRGLI